MKPRHIVITMLILGFGLMLAGGALAGDSELSGGESKDYYFNAPSTQLTFIVSTGKVVLSVRPQND